MRFHKYHALGNDYLVLDPADCSGKVPSVEEIKKICHRHYGLGSDGILYGPTLQPDGSFGLRIFNPDGSEAEKSGNGIRIFARYLWDTKKVGDAEFRIHTLGGLVSCVVREAGKKITVEMGSVSFRAPKIPVTGPDREVIGEKITVLDREFTFHAATVGNPHCVIPVPEATPELAQKYGPHLERHPMFPNRTNVQFLSAIDRNNIRIEIWERGAGYTYASGSSSSASAAIAHKIGLVDKDVTVHMPGGVIRIGIAEGYAITMTGPTTPVGVYAMNPEVVSQQVSL